MEEIIYTDVLVIGAGIAGLRAAIEVQRLGVKPTVITKGLFGRDAAATWMAGCGYQTWGIYPHDTLEVHAHDTIRCGWFLNNQENVYAFLALVPDTARELVNWGGRYVMRNKQLLPIWQLGQSIAEGRSMCPASYPRGALAYNLLRIFPQQIMKRRIEVVEDVFVVDLLTKRDAVIGALGIDIRTGAFKIFIAGSTILATGGYHGLYKAITANPNLTGDGQAIALRAGVDMMDFEFNQSLPCALWPPILAGDLLPFRMILDWGAYWYNSRGERFLANWDPIKMERSTRSVLSRAIFHEVRAGRMSPHGGVYSSVTHMPEKFIDEKLKVIEGTRSGKKLKGSGIDLKRDYLEVGYSIHYCQGGCDVNTNCETNRPGLYAVGEVASGSKDGADRMMSNALPFCMAMGIIAGRASARNAKTARIPEIDDSQVKKLEKKALAPLEREDGVRIYEAKVPFQELMVKETEYGRTEEGLKAVLSEVDRHKQEIICKLYVPNKSTRFNQEWINVLEFENLLLVAECVARNALMRTESRGLHDRLDYPNPDPNWFKNIHIQLVDGELRQRTTQVDFTYWEPETGSLGESWKKAIQTKEYRGWRAKPLYGET